VAGNFGNSGSTNGGFIDAAAGGSFATGGYITGPGTGTSDDIRAWLSNGEFVMNAEATKRNRSLLERLNNGQAASNDQHFATGGYVGGNAGATNSGSAAGLQVQIINQSGTPLQGQASVDNNGTLQILLTAVQGAIADDISSGKGKVYSSIKSRFGMKEAPG
jgi:hypothetical protein